MYYLFLTTDPCISDADATATMPPYICQANCPGMSFCPHSVPYLRHKRAAIVGPGQNTNRTKSRTNDRQRHKRGSSRFDPRRVPPVCKCVLRTRTVVWPFRQTAFELESCSRPFL